MGGVYIDNEKHKFNLHYFDIKVICNQRLFHYTKFLYTFQRKLGKCQVNQNSLLRTFLVVQ